MTNREAYLQWIKDYTNNEFKAGVPPIIEIVIDELIEADQSVDGVSSESLGDYSVSYQSSNQGYSKKTLDKLGPYIINKKVFFV